MVTPAAPAERELCLLLSGGGAVVLSGAGVSTNSGIPDYRDENGDWKRARPVEYRDFMSSEQTRRRYWARSMVGWPHIERALPNRAHQSISELEARQLVTLTVTQNVDGLHQRAGSRSVVDLHGRLDSVVCMSCKKDSARAELQARLLHENPSFAERSASTAPDGDADLSNGDTSQFRVVACENCGGILKPDVVFFGETVPKARVEHAYAAIEAARMLLVLGTSLMVFSGYRFARAAAKRGVPIAIVNRGKTRADDTARLKIEHDVADVLERVVAQLTLG
ncbi:MAG: NAD-dependent protein deacetylase [Polyangiaceae bacterium]